MVFLVRRGWGNSTAQASKEGVSDAFFWEVATLRMCAILLGRIQANVLQKRIGLANTYGGGITMTTLILIFGHNTPRLLTWIAKRLAWVAE